MAATGEDDRKIRVFCPKKWMLSHRDPGIQWLIGSPLFLPPFTVVSALRCLHTRPGDPHSPDFAKESDEIRTLLVRGFDVIGALYVGSDDGGIGGARKAIEASVAMRKSLFGDGSHGHIGAVGDVVTGDIRFFVSRNGNVENLDAFISVVYEDNAEAYIWEKGCLLRCCLELKLPVFVSTDKSLDVAGAISSSADAAVAKLKDPHVAYLVEGSSESDEASTSIVLHGTDLDFNKSCTDSMNTNNSRAEKTITKNLSCSQFGLKKKYTSSADIRESCDAIHVTVMLNQSRSSSLAAAPTAEYLPASGEYKYFNVDFKLDVLSYASEEFTIADAISMLIVPALVDQLNSIKKAVTPEVSQCPQLSPYHFLPAGLLHPITAIYDLRYGETEVK